MKKKIIFILIIIFLVISFLKVFYFSRSGSLFSKDDLKKDCLISSNTNEKYKNNVFHIEFNHPPNLVLCEKYPFNTKNQGVYIKVLDKTNFNSQDIYDIPVAIIYIKDTFLLDDYLMNFYNQEGFQDSGFFIDNKKIFKKDIQEKTCYEDKCKFKVYKFEIKGNPVMIVDYKNFFKDVIGSLSVYEQ